MRSILRFAVKGCLLLALVGVVVYTADELWARFKGRPTEEIKMGRVYVEMTHWNYVEYSMGTPVMETCVDALMPHFGYSPCWYLRRLPYRQIGP